MAGALARLGTDASLRDSMGKAGRARVLEYFCWDRVIERYVALWDSLAAEPLGPGELERLRGTRHPRLMRYAEAFRGHFSAVLDSEKLASMTVRRTPA